MMTCQEDLPSLFLEERALQEALTHILENALCYVLADGGPAKPQVSIQVKRGHQGDREMLQIMVEDNGVGINPEDLPHIFDPGFRGRKATFTGDEIDGSGMGLTIARRLLREMGAEIEVEPGSWGVRVIVMIILPDFDER